MAKANYWATLVRRFEDKWLEDEETGCWEWIAHTYNFEHGQFQFNKNGKQQRILAHRFSYELHVDAIPEGLLVCHTCDNPSCVNPEHLFTGTYSDNTKDMIKKGRRPCQKGIKNPRSKLTEQQVKAIRKDNRLQKEIAYDYNLSQGHVSALKRGEHYEGI